MVNVAIRGLLKLRWSRCNCRHFSRAPTATLPLFTSDRHPEIERGEFNKLTSEDVNFFKTILPDPSMILRDDGDEDLLNYNVDWLKIYRGRSKLVLRPKNTQDVSEILKYCNARRLAVVPQGGNTGLVGGSVPIFDEIVLSTQLMNKIINLDPAAGILTCQSGCILEQLNQYLNNFELMMPIDLGSKGSCNIGGNISTNAGGMRLLRYGNLHGSTLGLEVVKADGTVVDCMSYVRKDNVGYHMKHLFIGSEGTLGVVTKVSILCCKLLPSVNLALLGCNSFGDVLKILDLAKKELSEILSAFEFMDRDALTSSEMYLKTTCPLKESPFYVVLETSGSVVDHDQEKLSSFFETLTNSGLITDGTLALDGSKIEKLWKFRESIAMGLISDGHCYKYDISLPLSKYYEIVELTKVKLSSRVTRICGYGHVGDGNLHFNVTTPKFQEDVADTIEDHLYEFVTKNKGSISAEHGIGLFKRSHLHMGRTSENIQLMRQIKSMMDPNNILNPYKVLP